MTIITSNIFPYSRPSLKPLIQQLRCRLRPSNSKLAHLVGLRFQPRMSLGVCYIALPPNTAPERRLLSITNSTSTARKFYGDVFNWTFQPGSPDYPEDALAMFNYPDERLSTFAGGIVQYEKEKMMQGKGATLMYLWSEDIEATMEVCLFLIHFVVLTGPTN